MNIYGEKVMLRAMEPEDMEQLRETVNDPKMESLVGGWSFPVSKLEQQRWYESMVGNKTNLRFTIVLQNTKEAVGMVNLVNIDWKNRIAFTGIKLYQSAPHRQGIATDSIMAIMKYAFEELQLQRLDGSWMLDNIASRNAYMKCGWKEEGVKRRAIYKNGIYHDQAYCGILREEYMEAKQRLHWNGNV